jgi:alkylhydroperoxidase family enzyme
MVNGKDAACTVRHEGVHMTTLRVPQSSELSSDDHAILERVAKRMGQTVEGLLRPGIFGVQTHWPAWLEANFEHSLATYLFRGTLPPLAKEAMHVAVSVTNNCEY